MPVKEKATVRIVKGGKDHPGYFSIDNAKGGQIARRYGSASEDKTRLQDYKEVSKKQDEAYDELKKRAKRMYDKSNHKD